MAGPSNIEWTEATWNPFAGCAIVSPGCTNCYAMKMAARLDAMGQPLYRGLTKPSKAGPVWRGTYRANPDALLAPLKRKKPTTYFVNSMSDLFYEKFSDDMIDEVFAVMALSPQHTFQVLTKRAERMRDYFVGATCVTSFASSRHYAVGCKAALIALDVGVPYLGNGGAGTWPLPNVWLGVSTERQQEADERIPHLLQTPAAVRFISAEPLLGPIDLSTINTAAPGHSTTMGAKLDWVIVGGESGHGARPMHPAWARSLRDQCAAAGVQFFFKQWGEHSPRDEGAGEWMARVGKKAAGRLLDGIEHNAMPKVAA